MRKFLRVLPLLVGERASLVHDGRIIELYALLVDTDERAGVDVVQAEQCHALAEKPVVLSGALWSEDTQVMVECLQELGFMVTVAPDPAEPGNRTLTVYGRGGVVPRGGTALAEFWQAAEKVRPTTETARAARS